MGQDKQDSEVRDHAVGSARGAGKCSERTTGQRCGIRERRSSSDAAIIAGVEFADFHAQTCNLLTPFLRAYLEESLPDGKLRDASMHILCRGKMLRATAALATAVSYRPAFAIEEALPEVAALELVQTFTLIHDDLPVMDNADFRRGVPSVHRQFGEGYALLAGDLLLNLGFLVLVEKARSSPKRKLKMIQALSRAVRDIMEGQALELALSGKKVELPAVERMQWLKTGSLIAAAFRIGGLLAGIGRGELASLNKFARFLGSAYQVKDDLISAEGEPEEVGKSLEADALLERPTMVRALGLKRAQVYFERLHADARKSLDALSLSNPTLLIGFTKFLVARRK